ncbi:MAG TPA: GAF domain-containing protein [Phycisphaerales bacterium]|nr:GAF domain-containing protein [Phycisphaerales bacterium]HMP38218.1 GAF domain-containing protein [Phycisphaerales bacterium]
MSEPRRNDGAGDLNDELGRNPERAGRTDPGSSDALLAGIASASDLNAVLAATVEALDADSGTIHLLGEDGDLHLQVAVNIPVEVQAIVRVVPIGKGMAGLCAERNRPVDACNIQTDVSGDVRPGAKATRMEGAIVVPIRRQERVVGTLGVANRRERRFTPAEIELLERIGAIIADRAE